MKPRDGFNLPIAAPVLGAEALVVLAILIFVCFNATAIAEWLQ